MSTMEKLDWVWCLLVLTGYGLTYVSACKRGSAKYLMYLTLLSLFYGGGGLVLLLAYPIPHPLPSIVLRASIFGVSLLTLGRMGYSRYSRDR